jgi:hypothetical protein
MGAPDIDPFIGPTPKEIKGAARSFVGAAAQRDLLASAWDAFGGGREQIPLVTEEKTADFAKKGALGLRFA